jgi:hypothetical protein
MKLLTFEELRSSGILQETNRLWFHPVGLALSVVMPSGRLEIIDYREDPEGMIFEDGLIDASKGAEFAAFAESHLAARVKALGFVAQPLPGDAQ